MAFKITFTTRADGDFENILNYIESEFGTKTAIHFKDLIINFISLIQNFPELGTLERGDKNIRAFVIHYRLKIFYRIQGDNITVLRLFDTRQHPGKI